MTTVSHIALVCCLLCALGGMVRIFWPENGFKPVINIVLLLYIVSSVVPMLRQSDWAALPAQLRQWSRGTAAAPDYSGYAAALGRETASEALRQALAAQGIGAAVTVEADGCVVTLTDAADQNAAAALLQQACGSLPYRLLTPTGEGGNGP